MAERAREQSGPPGSRRGVALLLLTAPDRQGLLDKIDDLLARPEASLQSSGATPLQGARLAIAAPPQELRARLEIARSRLAGLARARLTLRTSGIYLGLDAAPPAPRRVAFLFPGQGSQHPGMLQELYQQTPIVRAWLDTLDAAYDRVGRPRPSELIYGQEGQDATAPPAALFSMERGAQLSTAVSLALYDLVGHLGIRADALVGHSIGEHAAVLAAHAGNADRRQAICAELCRLGLASVGMEEPPIPEGMAAVSAFSRPQLEAIVARHPQRLFIAMDNCPHQQVLAGERAALEEAMQAIVAAGGICAPLPFVRAYHTPLFGARAARLAAWYRQMRLTPAPLGGDATPVYSCLTHSPIPMAPAAAAQVMAQQWTAPVNFRATVEQLYGEGVDTFVEIGPDAKLTAFVEDILRGRPHLAVSLLGPATGSLPGAAPRDLDQIGHMLAALYAHGVPVEPARYDALRAGAEIGRLGDQEIRGLGDSAHARPKSLNPTITHALSVHRDLIDAAGAMVAATAARMQRLGGAELPRRAVPAQPAAATRWPLLGDQATLSAAHLTATRRFTLARDPFLADHSLGRSRAGTAGAGTLPVLSFTTSLALAAEAGLRLLSAAAPAAAEQPAILLTGIRAAQWLALDDGALTVRVDAARRGNVAQVSLVEEGQRAKGEAQSLLHNSQFTIRNSQFEDRAAFQATVELTPLPPAARSHADPAARPPVHWSAASFYADYAFHGPSFQGLEQVTSIGPNSGEAIVHVTDLPGIGHHALLLDPALLDCAGQLVAFWLLERGGRAPTFGIFPVSARRMVQHRPAPPPGSRLRCRCRVTLEPGGLTDADVVFFTAENQVVATIEGFVQRLIEFPPALAVALFGGAAVDFSQPLPAAPGYITRQIDSQAWALLQEGQGIWARLLAQQVLSPQERSAWRAETARAGWLLGRLVAKEAVAAWAARYAGQALPLANISFDPLSPRDNGDFEVACAGLAQPLHLHLSAGQQHLTAVVRQTTPTREQVSW